MPTRSRAASSAGSRRGVGSSRSHNDKDSVAAKIATATSLPFSLSLKGEDDFPVITIFIFCNGLSIEQKPDGRRCRTCPLCDDTYCPLALPLQRTKRFVRWSSDPDLVTGLTKRDHCMFFV